MSQGLPTFSLVCYKAAAEAKPVTVVPLENARLVVETGGVTEAGILVSPARLMSWSVGHECMMEAWVPVSPAC